MKGKAHFTEDEIKQISLLIEQKLKANTEDQKKIRNQIRSLGFYASDFGIRDGYTVSDFKSVINKMENSDSIHADLIRRYKIELQKNKLKDEIYKWNLLSQFKGRPNPEAPNFAEEIKSVKFHNLLYPLAISVSNHIAAERQEPYRECFKELFNEAAPLQNRVTSFGSKTLAIYRQFVPEDKYPHHQDERTMATFLTYHNPEKYSFYKDSFYQKYCKLLGIKSKKKGEKYVHYLELLSEFKEKFIDTDAELLKAVNALIPANAYKDPTHTLLAQDILYTLLDKGLEEIDIENFNVFKISMGSFSNEEMEACMRDSIVVVHSDTRGKGTSTETQAAAFEETMKVGDYFYLTHGNGPNSMKILGRITSESSASKKNYVDHSGWLQRKFEVVVTSVNQMAYKGPNKWWAPNNNSTCIQIKREELEEANKLLFEPYFNTHLISTADESATVQEPATLYQSEKMKLPLNQILFGPPGTGKTHTLLKEYYPLFTSQKQEVSEDQYKIELVSKYTWWQIVAAAVLDLKSTHVTQILNHQLVQIKDSVSDQKNARAMIWAMLQQHTKAECEYVKYSKRYEPLFFNKDKDGNWTIDATIADAEAPEVRELLDSWKKPATQNKEEIKRFEFITFHQSFSYEDFVEGIKPIMEEEAEEGDIRYKIEDGIFKRLCTKAKRDSENDYALFIDEINRGNVSQIFGELITLIEDDKREGKPNAIEVELPYSKKKFSVPSNLYIVGTMNTADRSVEALDTALRRRFSFTEMVPRYDLAELQTTVAGFTPSSILQKINSRLEKLLDKDHLIGHSYFLDINGDLNKLILAFQHKIIPLLQEYFYGDTGKIGLILGKGFFEAIEKEDDSLFADFEYDSSGLAERKVYHLINLLDKNKKISDQQFKEAIATLMK